MSQQCEYDENNECKACGEHFAAPHATGCPYGDGFDDMTVQDARELARNQARDRMDPTALAQLDGFVLRRVLRDIVDSDGVTHALAGHLALAEANTSDPLVVLWSMVDARFISISGVHLDPPEDDAHGS